MAALGYAPLEGLPGRYEFRRPPVVLRRRRSRLALQAVCEKSRRAAPPNADHLPPEPPSAGRFGDHDPDAALGIDAAAAGAREADDVGEVMGWLRAASERRLRRGRRFSAPAARLTPRI